MPTLKIDFKLTKMCKLKPKRVKNWILEGIADLAL